MSDPDRTPVYLRCRRDQHQWIAAWLPMNLGAFARLLEKATCPLCGKTDQVYMGYAPIDPESLPKEEPS